ncbi:MAG: SGNH/GDSL hydrolase family protein [Acidobacteriota bacterium]
MTSPRFRWPGRLLLILSSTVIALALTEGALRAYYWSRGVGRADLPELLRLSQQGPTELVDARSVFGIVQPSPFPDVVYELRPNLSGRFRGAEFATNRFGLRGPDTTRSKPAGTLRIAGLGDSHMFGWGVGQEETFLALLAQRLGQRGVEVETLNFAAPGYNTAIEAAVYDRKARHFDPDLVVLHFVGNDLGLPHHLQPPRQLQPSDWYLVESLRTLFADRGLDGELELLPHNLRRLPVAERHAARGRYAYMVGEEGYRRAMAKVAQATQRDGVPLLILLQSQRDLVSAVAAEHQIPVLDAAPDFFAELKATGDTSRAAWKATFRIPKDGHPTVAAHRAYAACLEQALAERGFIPSTAAGTVANR